MRAIVDDRARLQRMLDFEAALTRAEAAVGVVPASSVDAIAAACRAERYDIAALGEAAAAAGLDVFGGDVIVSPAGELTLIDLNDWPSFAPCRERAAYAIADFITKRVHAG